MSSKRTAKKAFDDDYSKIKPGYAAKKSTENIPVSEGFVNVHKQEKDEARNKALQAQALYRQELDAQMKNKSLKARQGSPQRGPLRNIQAYENENQVAEGFVNVHKQEKDEARNKALQAQAVYKQELDAQMKARTLRAQAGSPARGRGGSPQRSPTKITQAYENAEGYDYPVDQNDNPYADSYSPDNKGSVTKLGGKHKNLTESEIDRLMEQRRRQAEVNDYLQRQINEKQAKKSIEKEERYQFGMMAQQDAARSAIVDKESKYIDKARKQEYAESLGKQIAHNQQHKKTSLW